MLIREALTEQQETEYYGCADKFEYKDLMVTELYYG